ncbi:cis-3-alkyl-4-alkyloxetan-2-one decarboxylase isoform X2 [Rhodamnia argentea]|uniref:Cis-3-alkyl-4-alkyloxetan-2-one decarboxylase isoform X2 n=1 Tax=Rhodamnia argentea TaxID=178133 RepID=A0ABM3HRM6_9MYRT|nr:cis-3-alkyl-4-alkyloxetan-2-one decarboxylase isoform X2 [Rhodamnia argentea]
MAAFSLPLSPPLCSSLHYTSTTKLNASKQLTAKRRRTTAIVVKASEKKEEADRDTPEFNPFGFVTDNPSSRSAIQLPESPAEDGNVGQMLYRIEDKGKEYGSYIKSGKFRWFVRETGSPKSQRGTIVFLHGAPTQSYSYRVVMSEMSNVGFHCLAPDWIGFGFSDKPQPGYGFNYTEKEFHEELDRLLDVLGVKSPFFLVVQGFLVGSFGLTWALKNPSRISKLAILNSPLTASSPVPGLFQQLRIPLFGEFTCQNAVMAERFIEAALLEAARKANFKETATQIASGFSSGSWDKPILLAWGVSDKYLPQSVAEEFQKGNPSLIKLKLIEGAGHMPQEDWPEKVVEALRMFLL